MISESWLEKCLESETKKRSAIVITVGTSEKAIKLFSERLRFRGALKVAEKYWKTRPVLVYLNYVGVGHDCLRKYRAKSVECIICINMYKAEDYKYRIIGYNVKIGKICTNVILKYTNCSTKYKAIAFKCPVRLKAKLDK